MALRAQRIILGDAGGPCVCIGKVSIGLGCGDLGVKAPGTVSYSYL